jgi:LMBR1 domain-containing protein 1
VLLFLHFFFLFVYFRNDGPPFSLKVLSAAPSGTRTATMIDVWLIVTMIVVSVLVLVGSIYFLVYFQSPEDHNQAWIPKIVTVIGMCAACILVLMLPLSVANRNSGNTLDTEILWQFILMSIAGLCFVVIPFCIFYYEAQDPDSTIGSQIVSAVMYTAVMVFISALITTLMYIFLGYTEIPYKAYSVSITKDVNPVVCIPGSGTGGCSGSESVLEIRVSVVVYIIAMIAVVGYMLFTLFGGIGLIALPLDCFNAFKNKPKKLDATEKAKIKVDLATRATKLISSGKELDARRRSKGGTFDRKGRKAYLQFKRAVYFLERDFEKLRLIEQEGGGSPFKWYGILLFGMLGSILSFCWLLHILFFMFIQPPLTPFLNTMFIDLDRVFALFGTFAYGLFAFYLLLCTVKGCVKFGLRLLCIAIHPMSLGNTLMNSFLFNVGMINFSAVAVVQFSTQAFSLYARDTDASSLFGVYIKYLKYVSYLWTYYLYFFWAIAGLTLLYVIACPGKRKEEDVDVELIALQGGVKETMDGGKKSKK